MSNLINEQLCREILDSVEKSNCYINDSLNMSMHSGINSLDAFWCSDSKEKFIRKYKDDICPKYLGRRYDDIHNLTEGIKINKIPDLKRAEENAKKNAEKFI